LKVRVITAGALCAGLPNTPVCAERGLVFEERALHSGIPFWLKNWKGHQRPGSRSAILSRRVVVMRTLGRQQDGIYGGALPGARRINKL